MFRPRPFDLRWACRCCGAINPWSTDTCRGPLGCSCGLMRIDSRCRIAAMFARIATAVAEAEVAA